MNRLDFVSSEDDYTVQFGCSVQKDDLLGGFSRYSTATESKKHLVSLGKNVNESDYLYFRAFYLNWQLDPQPFLMKLIIESAEYKDYICQFVPDSFNFAELNGRIFNVSAQVLVVISPVIALTSRMYPFQFVESLITDFALTDVLQRQVMNLTDADVEAVQTAFALSQATIRSSIVLYPDPGNSSGSGATGGGNQAVIESMQTSFAMTGATIETYNPYRSTTTSPESVNTAFALVSASQRTALLSNTIQPENVATSFALVGAQITN